jgi:myo-inositol catabolism protein IolC
MEGMAPTHLDPLFILAMDHRDSFGHTLFGVATEAAPTGEQTRRMRAAKSLIYAGLRAAVQRLPRGRAGVLVDEAYGQDVIDQARADGLTLAVPIEASGREWFATEWGDAWLEHVERVRPDYAKVLVRDNPAFDESERQAQLNRLAAVSAGLDQVGVPLLYELLVPATDKQLASVGGDAARYDADLRPGLVVQVIADNQGASVHPRLWKVEGLETVAAARQVADQAGRGSRPADLIVLGRDAPTERLDHWLTVASAVDAFVGFAIGRSIWEDVIRDHEAGTVDDAGAAERIAQRYLSFAGQWRV